MKVRRSQGARDNLYYMMLVAIALLVGGLVFNLPYDYYGFLRLVVSFVAVVFAWVAVNSGSTTMTIIMIGIAILYNPVAQFHLGRDLWMVANIITILLFGFFWRSKRWGLA